MFGSRNSWFLVSVLVTTSLLLASCAPATAPTPPPKPAVTSPTAAPAAATPKPAAPTPSPKPVGQPKYGGVLTASVYMDTGSLDPHQEVAFPVLTITQPAMQGLLKFDPSDPSWKVRPSLAEKWEISKEGTKITFYLKKGINWHDGKPFTSADAKFSLERAGFNPPKGLVSPRTKGFDPIEKIETPDDNTLVLTLKHPSDEIMDVVASGFHLVMPKHIIEPLGGAKIRKVEHIIGTGPFKLKSYDSGVGWRLVKNTAYYDASLPYLDEIRYYIVRDDATRFGAFRTKSVLIEAKSPGLTPAQKETVEKSAEAAQIVITGGVVSSIWGLMMNTRHPGPLGDVRVRKAFHLAMDRQRMQKLFGQTQAPGVIGSLIFPGSKFAPTQDMIDRLPGFRQPKDQDLAEAKRLIEEAKLPKDFSLALIVREGAIYRDQGTIAAEELRHLGVSATVKVLDMPSWYDVQDRRDFAAMPGTMGFWSPSPHIGFGERYVAGGGRNVEGVADERLDALYAKQSRSMDVEERKKIFWEMERILREEIIPMAPFYWATKYTAYWKVVKGYPGLGLGYYEGNSMEEVWLDK